MASRRLVPASVREALLGIPSDIASLERNYLLADDDLDLIGTRRRPENRLGLALHIALLRHPGQGWHDDTAPPPFGRAVHINIHPVRVSPEIHWQVYQSSHRTCQE